MKQLQYRVFYIIVVLLGVGVQSCTQSTDIEFYRKSRQIISMEWSQDSRTCYILWKDSSYGTLTASYRIVQYNTDGKELQQFTLQQDPGTTIKSAYISSDGSTVILSHFVRNTSSVSCYDLATGTLIMTEPNTSITARSKESDVYLLRDPNIYQSTQRIRQCKIDGNGIIELHSVSLLPESWSWLSFIASNERVVTAEKLSDGSDVFIIRDRMLQPTDTIDIPNMVITFTQVIPSLRSDYIIMSPGFRSVRFNFITGQTDSIHPPSTFMKQYALSSLGDRYCYVPMNGEALYVIDADKNHSIRIEDVDNVCGIHDPVLAPNDQYVVYIRPTPYYQNIDNFRIVKLP
jgi:hypothetical protein